MSNSAAPVPRNDDDDERADALRMLADSAQAFAGRECTPGRIRAWRDRAPGFDRALWHEMAQQGWLGILVHEDFGGLGLGFAEMRLVAERLGGALAPEPLTACAVLAARAILHGDNAALKRRLLPRLVAGDWLPALAWQESLCGTDAAARVQANRNGDGIRLNGSKQFVTPLQAADGFIISAQSAEGLLLVHVPAHAAGLKSHAHLRADGSYSGSIEFHDTPVAAGDIVASANCGTAALARAIDEATLMACAEMLGVMTRAIDITLEYLRTRVQFDKPIGSFQALQHRTVDLWMQQQLCAALLARAVQELDTGVTPGRLAELASRCKARCAEAVLDITRECIRLHGAIGFTDDCDIGLHLQRALVLAPWLGNSAEHRRRFDQGRAGRSESVLGTADVIATGRPAALPGEPGERPADTDWNALSDEVFRFEAASFYDRHYPKALRFAQRRPQKAEFGDYIRTLSRLGWLAPAWPRRWGGMELSPAKQLILFEERERIGAMRVLEQGITHVGPLLMKFGSPEQQQHYLPRILSGEHIWCQGYSEPNAGSDLASLRTSAIRDGDHYVINGSKIWTSMATEATHIYVLARTDPGSKRQGGISFFLVDIRTPGISLRPIRTLAGEEPFCQTFFDNVRVPAANIVGKENEGWTVAKGLLGFERLTSGDPRRPRYPLTRTREIAEQRGLWEDADFRSRYTRLELDVHDLGVIFQEYADIVTSGKTPGPGISMLKIWSSETTLRMCGLLLEVAGSAAGQRGELSIGSARADILGSYYTVFPATIASGTNDIQRNVLAKRVLGLP